jgi:hypothetical protein
VLLLLLFLDLLILLGGTMSSKLGRGCRFSTVSGGVTGVVGVSVRNNTSLERFKMAGRKQAARMAQVTLKNANADTSATNNGKRVITPLRSVTCSVIYKPRTNQDIPGTLMLDDTCKGCSKHAYLTAFTTA